MSESNSYHIYIFWYVLFYFFNSIFLPEGLLYTSLLSPVLLYWLYRQNALKPMFKWVILILLPLPVYWIQGIDTQSFIVSTLLILTAWILLFAALQLVRLSQNHLHAIFTRILNINLFLVLLAIVILPFGSVNFILWDFTPISPDVPVIPRLKMFGYEPSHYGLLLSPVFIYFIWKVITGQSERPMFTSLAVAIPLILSLSFGIIAGLILSVGITILYHFRHINVTVRKRFIAGGIFLVLSIVLFLLLLPENAVSLRVSNIIDGRDTSMRGRLFDSFMFARDLLINYNVLFGVGPGQVKILAHDMIVNYYQYEGNYASVMRIPNSMAETLAIFGIYGFLLKLLLPVYFFFKFRIMKNLFSCSLFIFIFLYQFTGSFLVNAAEIGIWALVFSSHLKYFQINEKLNA